MLFQKLLAWTLPLIALVLLILTFRKCRLKVVRAIACYVAFSVIFGCIHFLLYRYNPALYEVKEVKAQSAGQGEISIGPNLEAYLTQISVLDALILQMGDHPTKSLEPLKFTTDLRHYPLRYSTIDVETLNNMTLVGPNKDQASYSAAVTVIFASDYRGIAKGTKQVMQVDSPNKDHFQIEEPQSEKQVLAQRRDLANKMSKLFQPGTIKAINFSLLDFLYFSFSIVGLVRSSRRVF